MYTVPMVVFYSMMFAAAACVVVPLMYLFFIRKKIVFKAILLGLAAYLLLADLISNLLQGFIAGGIKSPVLFSLVTSVIIVAVEETGRYFMLKLLQRSEDTPKMPLSYGFGYSLFPTIWLSGRNAIMAYSMAFAINQKGIDAILATVDDKEQMRETLNALVESKASLYLLGAGEVVCSFSNSIALSVIMWYSVKEGGDRRFLYLAMAARFIVELPLSFYTAGGTSNGLWTDIIYFVVSAMILALAVLLRRKKEGSGLTETGPRVRRR